VPLGDVERFRGNEPRSTRARLRAGGGIPGSSDGKGSRATDRGETPGVTGPDRGAFDQANSLAWSVLILCIWPFWKIEVPELKSPMNVEPSRPMCSETSEEIVCKPEPS